MPGALTTGPWAVCAALCLRAEALGHCCLLPVAQRVPQLNKTFNNAEVPLKMRWLMNEFLLLGWVFFFFSLLRCVWMPTAILAQSGIDHHPACAIQSVVTHFLIVSLL